MLKIDISLKDKTIADLVKEKSQLMEKEKEKETFKHIGTCHYVILKDIIFLYRSHFTA